MNLISNTDVSLKALNGADLTKGSENTHTCTQCLFKK